MNKEKLDKLEFNSYVYTPFSEAVNELYKRWDNKELEKDIFAKLKGNIPNCLKKGFTTVLFRQLATPNYELRRFLSISDALEWNVVFWEYYNDKFTSNNPCKYHLGKMAFYSGIGKKGGVKLDYLKVIDFNKFNGKKISAIETTWGQKLIDFHHELFFRRYPSYGKEIFFDASKWFELHGSTAKDYYESFITLFLRNGILFENFILDDDDEHHFTKEIFLPVFKKVWEETGHKPLIVALEPTESEDDEFWLCYPNEMFDTVNKFINMSTV